MPRISRSFSGGFIDIISLIAVVFLVITTITGVIVTNRENANFDLRNKAAMTTKCPNGAAAPDGDVSQCPPVKTTPPAPAPPAAPAAPTCLAGRINTAGTCPDGKTIKYVWRNTDCTETTDTCTESQNTPGCTAGTVMNTAGTCPDGKTIKYVRLNADCKTTTTDTCTESQNTPICLAGRINTAGTCPDGKTIKYVWRNTDCTETTDTCTPEQNIPTCQASIINTAGTCPNGVIKYVHRNVDCTTTTDTCPDSPAPVPAAPIPVAPPAPIPVAPPAPIPVAPPAAPPAPAPAPPSCFDSCQTGAECGSGNYCHIPATGCRICKAQTCTPNQQICSGGILKLCNTIGSALNTLISCPNGCNNTNTGCQPPPPPAPPPVFTPAPVPGTVPITIPVPPPPACIDPCFNDSDCGLGNYCYKPPTGCSVCKTAATLCTPGAKQCSGNYLQACNSQGTSWLSDNCGSAGCNSTTKACNPAPISTPTPTPTSTPSPSWSPSPSPPTGGSPSPSATSCSSFGACFPDNYTCEKSFGQLNCGTGNVCGVHCSAPTPNPASTTLKASGSTCTTDSQCSSGSCKQKTNALPTKYCADVDPSKASNGSGCSSDSDCQSGGCYPPTASLTGMGVDICAGSQIEASFRADAKSVANLATNPNTLITAALVGTVALLTQNPGTAPYLQPIVQNALNLLPALVGTQVVYDCEKYGTYSNQCIYGAGGIYSGYSANPFVTEQALQTSAQTISNITDQAISKLANSSLGNTLFGNPSNFQLTNAPTMNGQSLETSINYSDAAALKNLQDINAQQKQFIESQGFTYVPMEEYVAPGTSSIGNNIPTNRTAGYYQGGNIYIKPTDNPLDLAVTQLHESGHALRDIPGSTNAIYDWAKSANQFNLEAPLEEVGNISTNVLPALKSAGFSDTSAAVTWQENYLQYNAQLYLDRLKNPNPPTGIWVVQNGMETFIPNP